MKLRIPTATMSLPLAACALASCAVHPPPPIAAPPPIVVLPLEVTTTFITARVPRSSRGEFAIVEVCVAPDGVIAALRIAQSSADKAFDTAAMQWARQARYRPQLENGRPVYACEQVRVEVNPNPSPRLSGGADSALG